nr:ribokinase [Mangrovicoccus algicola]
MGSINIDKVLRVPHLPSPGETLAARSYAEGLGGKGANQSVAAARAGAQVVHLGAIGPDGGAMLDLLARDGVATDRIARLPVPTGMALIMVDDAAENTIAILAGANREIPQDGVTAALEGARRGDTLLLQNETGGQVAAAEQARSRGMRVVVSAAPFDMAALAPLLPLLSVLLLNEVEAAQLEQAAGRSLAALALPHVVVTRGARGATHLDGGTGESTTYPAFRVAPVDTTGAGDTFAGYLAAGLDQGLDWSRALPRAQAAAALSVTRAGAAASIPGAAETAEFLAKAG